MRNLSQDLITKSAQTNQTIAADAEPYVSLRIARRNTILDNINLAEKVRVRRMDANLITDADVAVQHPRFKGENTKIWVAYIRRGQLAVRWAYDRENITEISWTGIDLGVDATACAIAFNSEVIENARNYSEFVTVGEYPYVFYVDTDGALHYILLGDVIQDEVLALANVTDVSAVRGPSGKHGSWDMGLTVFFLMNGVLYYRQLIGGVWYDAEQVTLEISGETYEAIDAFVTWDYRVGVQVLTSSGKLYQIITYTEGIGARGSEHIQISANAKIVLSGINYYAVKNEEHIDISPNANISLIYGLTALPTSVANIEDEEENWGTTIIVTFDYPNTSSGSLTGLFTLVDTGGNNYNCTSAVLTSSQVLTLVFDDFNLAEAQSDNTLTLTYTKPSSGGLLSPAVQTDSFTLEFEPENLEAPQIDPPTFLSATNNAAGTQVTVYFTEEITNADVSGMTSNFTIGLHEYNYVPNGTLQDTTRTISSMDFYEGNILDLGNASMTDVEYIEGAIRLEADI